LKFKNHIYKMKKIKLTFLSLALALALTGCSTTKVTMYNVDALPVKKEKITVEQLQRWSHLDVLTDTIPGMSVDKAYAELLKDKKGTKIIVGIIDSGVDIEHPDLVDAIWTNPKEIAGNDIDDDNNGYIDDIHGWNFLGDITKELLEYERIINDKSLVDNTIYLKAKAIYDEKLSKATSAREQMEQMLMAYDTANPEIVKILKKESYTADDLKTITSTDPKAVQSKQIMKELLSFGIPLQQLRPEIKKELEGIILSLNDDNIKTNYRKVLGDNPNDLTDTKYGNNNVIGPDKQEALHGTHVAGIVAQGRYNAIGGDGVASNNVEIMAVRAVPDGDEYDKDIALAIRYAVDNGAKVINGSFGKSFSPHKQWVYDAIKYAEKKDVLIVHAAGNDAKNIDIEDNFPNDSDDKVTEFADNLITIGALNYEYGENVVANFSNFGVLNVDVFAPGVQIYATTPENTYQYLAGTSMASPNVAGVAALIRSYYPKLSASQVKHILMDSGTAINTMVQVGGRDGEKKQFSTLSKSGRIVNAYSALQMAAKMSGK
jgi:cell wall-associated protease